MILTPATYTRTLDYMSERAARISHMIRKLSDLLKLKHFVLSHSEHKKKNSLTALTREIDTPNYWVENGMPLPLILPNGFYLASQFKTLFHEQTLTVLREKYDVDHYLFYVQHNHDSTDMFSMATHPDNKTILNDYINHSHTIRKLLLHFRQEAKELLLEARNYTLGYDYSLAAQKKIFPEKLHIPRYNGFSSLYDIADVLSPRELMCLELTGATVSIKSIAQKLKLSPRTVESYLINVRNKLGCENLASALDLYHAVSGH